jgi:hypothetical protein
MSPFCYRHGRQMLLTGANLWVGAYCDTPLGCNPLLRRKYHVTEVGCGMGRPDRQRSHVIGFQRDPWWCLPTSRGDKTVPLLHATRQLVDPIAVFIPPCPPRSKTTNTVTNDYAEATRSCTPCGGTGMDPWWLELGPKVRRKTYYFF